MVYVSNREKKVKRGKENQSSECEAAAKQLKTIKNDRGHVFHLFTGIRGKTAE